MIATDNKIAMDECIPRTVSVLYAEDEPATRELVTNILSLKGYRCIVAENGLEGLKLYREHIPDIVISDILMPIMSGLDMARAIRADFPDTLFIFLTALEESSLILEAIDIGVTQYVIKPVELTKLLAAISHCESIIRQKAEAQKIKHLEAIGILAGGLAHDYNNLLQIILGHVSLAKLCVEPTSDAYEYLNTAESFSSNAKELSQKLLIFSEGSSGLKQKIFLPPILMSSVMYLTEGTCITPVFDMSPEVPQLMLNPTQMQQVFRNLTVNAIEAMPQGGKLVVAAKIANVTMESGLTLPPGDYVHISFSDTGIGIPIKNLPKIFDPYFTTKHMDINKGQGLGLSVCYAIIRKHGGMISANNVSGAGAILNIWLPVDEKTM